MRPWVALLGALAATSVAMINSDGLGASARVPPNPLGWKVNITAFGPANDTLSQWPAGFAKGLGAFYGAVFDGANVCLKPQDADRIVLVHATSVLLVSMYCTPQTSRRAVHGHQQDASGRTISSTS